MTVGLKHLPGRHDQQTHTPKAYVDIGIGYGSISVSYSRGAVDLMHSLKLGERHLEDMYSISGYHASVNVDAVESGIDVQVELVDESGEKAGSCKRTFFKNDDGTFSVRNSNIELYMRGTGIGSALYDKQINVLSSLGYKSIHLQANSTIGRYAWARKGFDFMERGGYKQKKLDKFNAGFRKWALGVGLSEDRLGGWPTFTSAKSIADYDPGIRISSMSIVNEDVPSGSTLHVGKAFMLDLGGEFDNWYGELTLNE